MKDTLESIGRELLNVEKLNNGMLIKYEVFKKDILDLVQNANVEFVKANKKSKITLESLETSEIDELVKEFGLSLAELKNQQQKIVEKFKKLASPYKSHIEKVIAINTRETLNSCFLDGSQIKNLIDLLDFPQSTKWKLIYSGKRDGFGANDFHSRCDLRSLTLTIIKSDSGNIFGGYTEAKWSADEKDLHDPKSFLFSIENQMKKLFKTGTCLKEQPAISYCPTNGPIFGYHDITISDKCNTEKSYISFANNSSTSYLIYYQSFFFNNYILGCKHYNFQVVEIEVFEKYSLINYDTDYLSCFR